MNTDERRAELLSKANQMIDTISESMRMVENVEAAKKKFLRADAQLSLEIPIQGTGGMSDVFKMDEIFDERGIEKIKAYILTELEFLEEESLKILDNAGFHTDVPKEQDWMDIPFAPEEGAPLPEEDDSDMIVVPDKIEKKARRGKAIADEKVEEMKKLADKGMKPLQIAKELGVSHQSVYRHLAKDEDPFKDIDAGKKPGRSASRSGNTK